jgi:hypothetical protein
LTTTAAARTGNGNEKVSISVAAIPTITGVPSISTSNQSTLVVVLPDENATTTVSPLTWQDLYNFSITTDVGSGNLSTGGFSAVFETMKTTSFPIDVNGTSQEPTANMTSPQNASSITSSAVDLVVTSGPYALLSTTSFPLALALGLGVGLGGGVLLLVVVIVCVAVTVHRRRARRRRKAAQSGGALHHDRIASPAWSRTEPTQINVRPTRAARRPQSSKNVFATDGDSHGRHTSLDPVLEMAVQQDLEQLDIPAPAAFADDWENHKDVRGSAADTKPSAAKKSSSGGDRGSKVKKADQLKCLRGRPPELTTPNYFVEQKDAGDSDRKSPPLSGAARLPAIDRPTSIIDPIWRGGGDDGGASSPPWAAGAVPATFKNAAAAPLLRLPPPTSPKPRANGGESGGPRSGVGEQQKPADDVGSPCLIQLPSIGESCTDQSQFVWTTGY